MTPAAASASARLASETLRDVVTAGDEVGGVDEAGALEVSAGR